MEVLEERARSVKGKKWCQATPSTMVDRRTFSGPFENFCPLQRLLQNPCKIPAQTRLFQKQLNHFRTASKYLNNPSRSWAQQQPGGRVLRSQLCWGGCRAHCCDHGSPGMIPLPSANPSTGVPPDLLWPRGHGHHSCPCPCSSSLLALGQGAKQRRSLETASGFAKESGFTPVEP